MWWKKIDKTNNRCTVQVISFSVLKNLYICLTEASHKNMKNNYKKFEIKLPLIQILLLKQAMDIHQ